MQRKVVKITNTMREKRNISRKTVQMSKLRVEKNAVYKWLKLMKTLDAEERKEKTIIWLVQRQRTTQVLRSWVPVPHRTHRSPSLFVKCYCMSKRGDGEQI